MYELLKRHCQDPYRQNRLMQYLMLEMLVQQHVRKIHCCVQAEELKGAALSDFSMQGTQHPTQS